MTRALWPMGRPGRWVVVRSRFIGVWRAFPPEPRWAGPWEFPSHAEALAFAQAQAQARKESRCPTTPSSR